MSEQYQDGGVATAELEHQVKDLEQLSTIQAGNAEVTYYGSFYKRRPEAEFVTATILGNDGETEDLVLRVVNERGSHNDILTHMLMVDGALTEGESPRLFVSVFDSKNADNHMFFETDKDSAAKDFQTPFTAPAARP
jgi:hypothetical protein